MSGGLRLIVVGRPGIERWVARQVPWVRCIGPVDAARAVNATLWALIQGGSVYAAAAVLAAWPRNGPA